MQLLLRKNCFLCHKVNTGYEDSGDIFSLLILLSELGCGSKEDIVAPEGVGTTRAASASIVGKWQLVEVQHASMVAEKPTTTQVPPYRKPSIYC